jgi:hypothetical protein
VNISSATNNTYILVEADDGTDITCSVTAINSAGSASAASNIIEVRHMTTADGKQVWWVVGDSLTTKRNPTGTAYGPTPTAGTVYQCDDSTSYAVNQIGATDITQSGAGANWGSMWPQTGIEAYNATGKKPVFACCGVGGTNYVPRTGDTGDWSDADTIYSSKKTILASTLSAVGVLAPKYIIMHLGVNDARGDAVIATVLSGIDAFFLKLTTDFPSATVLLFQIGRDNIGSNTNRQIQIRNKHREITRSYNNIYICGSMTAMDVNSYIDDQIHLLQTGNNEAGKMVGRWLSNSGYSKMARAIIASHFNDLSTGDKTKIEAALTTLDTSFYDLDYLYVQKQDVKDTWLDYCLLSAADNAGSSTHTTNAYRTTNGTSTYKRMLYNTTDRAFKATQNDGFCGIKVKTNRSTAGGTTRAAIGGGSATSQTVIGQTNTSTLYYRYNDLTTSTYASETKLQDNSFYVTGRNSGTKYLYKNGSELANASVASVATFSPFMNAGCINGNGTNSGFIDMDFEYEVGGKYSTVNQTTLYNAMEALVS